MSRSTCVPSYLAGVLLIVIGWPGTSPGQGTKQDQSAPEARAILTQMRLALDRLRSIQYHARMKRTQHIPIPSSGQVKAERAHRETPEVLDCTMEFALQGQQYYSRTRFKGKTRSGKPIETTVAFNGDKHQRLSEPSRVLEVTSRTPNKPYYQLQPIMVPFLFAYRETDPLEYGVLVDTSLWDELASRTRIGGRDKVNGHACRVLTITRPVLNRPATVTVYAASKLDYFPMRSVLVGRDHRAETDVISFEEVKSEDGRVVVPTHVVVKDYLADGKLWATTELFIEPATLRVNEKIPPEIFTIAKSRADVYYDADLRKSTRLKP